MRNLIRHDITFLWIIFILFNIIKSSYETIYSCNVSASCGCSTRTAVLTKIVGGEPASIGSWGWAVSISIADSYLCGGSILSSSWVITAAHCVKNFKTPDIIIYAGSNIQWAGSQIRSASHTFVHSNYNSTSYVNDIALIRLTSPLRMNDPNVNAICLEFINSAALSNEEWPPVNTAVVAVGWGILNENGPSPGNLQQITLQTIDRHEPSCSPLLHDWHVQLCASVSNGEKDTCYGDSGGPLMMFTSSHRWVLVGLTSSGIGCARPMYSGIYTRIGAYENWIKSIINGSYSISKSSSIINRRTLIDYLTLFIFSIIVIAFQF